MSLSSSIAEAKGSVSSDLTRRRYPCEAAASHSLRVGVGARRFRSNRLPACPGREACTSGMSSALARRQPFGYGYDAAHNTYVDMVANGIIDPAKVTRAALENAASIAALVLTTETLVTDIPEKNPAPMMDPEAY